MNLIGVNNIKKVFKSDKISRIIFEDFSISINQGERIAIVGSNGSGKSTLLKIILGQLKPEQGSITINSNLENIVYLPQDYRNALFPWLTVKSNLSLLLCPENSFSDLSLTENIEITIENLLKELAVNIDLNKYPYQLSGGEQQTLLIIQAVLKNSKILFGDELFSAIDFHKKEIIEKFYQKWVIENNVTSILVTHDIEQAVFLSNRLIVLNKKNNIGFEDLKIDFPFPRNESLKYDQSFRNLLSNIKALFE